MGKHFHRKNANVNIFTVKTPKNKHFRRTALKFCETPHLVSLRCYFAMFVVVTRDALGEKHHLDCTRNVFSRCLKFRCTYSQPNLITEVTEPNIPRAAEPVKSLCVLIALQPAADQFTRTHAIILCGPLNRRLH